MPPGTAAAKFGPTVKLYFGVRTASLPAKSRGGPSVSDPCPKNKPVVGSKPLPSGNDVYLASRYEPASFSTKPGNISGNICQVASKSTPLIRSEEHTSELQSLMRISYAVFCL